MSVFDCSSFLVMVLSICMATMYLSDTQQKYKTEDICMSTASICLGTRSSVRLL